MTEIFDILIFTDLFMEVKGKNDTVKMIGFTGKCTGQYFNGEVLSGGVDTQFIDKNGRASLSARYMMKGIDCKGNACAVFIQNEGVADSGEEIKTIPKIVTDSKELAWLEDSHLCGKVQMENNELHVRIYSNE